MQPIQDFIENPVALAPDRPFGAILGLAPSKGARSPVLWRAAFEALGIAADFHPFDVQPDKLAGLIAALAADSRFVGGAVAVPYKEALPPLLGHVDAGAAAVGAVNAVRRTADGRLAGANTDGLAAVETAKSLIGDLAGRRVVCLGAGGAGKAVAASLALAGATVTVWSRRPEQAVDFASRMTSHSIAVRASADLRADLAPAALLVNCTSAGFSADSAVNAVTPVALAMLTSMAPGSAVFDIIYQPTRTALLAAAEDLGLKTANGKQMNLVQAAIAFGLAFPQTDAASVAHAMGRV